MIPVYDIVFAAFLRLLLPAFPLWFWPRIRANWSSIYKSLRVSFADGQVRRDKIRIIYVVSEPFSHPQQFLCSFYRSYLDLVLYSQEHADIFYNWVFSAHGLWLIWIGTYMYIQCQIPVLLSFHRKQWQTGTNKSAWDEWNTVVEVRIYAETFSGGIMLAEDWQNKSEKKLPDWLSGCVDVKYVSFILP